MLPDVDVAGSTLELVDGRRYVHGGCVFFQREAATKIANSKLLENPQYKWDRRFGYRRYEPPYLQYGEVRSDEWIISGDAVLADVVSQLSLTTEDWVEVSCGRETSNSDLERYAVFHSAKTKTGVVKSVKEDWNGLLGELRGSAYFGKTFKVSEGDTKVNTHYTTLLAALSFQSVDDLRFSLFALRESMSDYLTAQDISNLNEILTKYNFGITL